MHGGPESFSDFVSIVNLDLGIGLYFITYFQAWILLIIFTSHETSSENSHLVAQPIAAMMLVLAVRLQLTFAMTEIASR